MKDLIRMQKTKYHLILLACLCLFAVSCSDDDNGGQSEEEQQATRLAGTWELGENGYAMSADTDVSDEYADLSMRFTTSHAYTVLNDPDNVFYPTGIWQFDDDSYSVIYLNGTDVPLSLDYESEDVLIISFTISGDVPIGQRVSGISGNYEFRLERQ